MDAHVFSERIESMKILVVGLFPNESCPYFSYALASGLVNNKCEVYAILPTDVKNKSAWLDLLGEAHLDFVTNMECNISYFN